jgi:hypothetical protein
MIQLAKNNQISNLSKTLLGTLLNISSGHSKFIKDSNNLYD